MHHSRPKNLNLFTIRFPLPAIVSILHRVTGVVLFLFIPVLLWLLQYSLTVHGFESIEKWLSYTWVKAVVWLLFIPLCFHLIAGIRHLLSDIHLGDSLGAGRKSALLVFVFSIVILLLAGIWLW